MIEHAEAFTTVSNIERQRAKIAFIDGYIILSYLMFWTFGELLII